MELYQKKRYIANPGNKRQIMQYGQGNNDLNKKENIYFQKLLEQNQLTDENILNIRKNMKSILSNENNLKRAIKYVSKYNQSTSNETHINRNLEKSASPLGRSRRQRNNEYNPNTTPIRRLLNITKEPLYHQNNIKYENQKDINKNKEELYEIEISSINENGMPKSKSPEKINYLNNNINIENNDDDINELITTIEDLQSIINGQKHEIKNIKKENKIKDREIDYLKKEINELRNEIDEKMVEHDKNIEDIFKNDDVIKLKKEYFKLLQDYDDNINDYNKLKDDYNKMVDEYNNIKKEKNKLIEEIYLLISFDLNTQLFPLVE